MSLQIYQKRHLGNNYNLPFPYDGYEIKYTKAQSLNCILCLCTRSTFTHIHDTQNIHIFFKCRISMDGERERAIHIIRIKLKLKSLQRQPYEQNEKHTTTILTYYIMYIVK